MIDTILDKYEYRRLGDFIVGDTIHYVGSFYRVTGKLCTSNGHVTLLATMDDIEDFPIAVGLWQDMHIAVKWGQ